MPPQCQKVCIPCLNNYYWPNMKEVQKKEFPFYGTITVIKRSGGDGSIFPMTCEDILIGRGSGCDIRVTLPTVSRKHCHITVTQNAQALLTNLSDNSGQTLLNQDVMDWNETLVLKHGDVITVGDRSFRFSYPDDSPHKPRKRSRRYVWNFVLYFMLTLRILYFF